VTPQKGNLNEPVTVSFDVKNIGDREGAEVAELYVGDSHASVPRPVKELKGFTKTILKPGESKHLTLTLDRRAFLSMTSRSAIGVRNRVNSQSWLEDLPTISNCGTSSI
jgi:beta-glucosidase